MKNLWQRLKQEFIKTFVCGDKVKDTSFPFSGVVDRHPSRIGGWWQNHVRHWFDKENTPTTQTLVAVLTFIVTVVGVVIAYFS